MWIGLVLIVAAALIGAERGQIWNSFALAIPQMVAALAAAGGVRVARAFIVLADTILTKASHQEPWPANRIEDRNGFEIIALPDGGVMIAGSRFDTIEAARAEADRRRYPPVR